MSGRAAMSATHRTIDYSYLNDTALSATVKTIFLKQDSWVSSELTDSTYVLNHEQGHFNIAEIHSRKLKKELKIFENENYQKNYTIIKSKMSQLILDATNNERYMQDLYDMETEHSQNREKQKEWDEKIQKMIASENTIKQ